MQPATLNRQTKIKILRMIWEKKVISRADIARFTGLSATAVTRHMDGLIEMGLVKDMGVGDSIPGGGRPPNLLAFNGEDNFILGIELSPTEIQGVLTNLQAQCLEERRVAILPGTDFMGAMRDANTMIIELIRASNVGWDQVCGVGMAVSGFAGPQKKTFGLDNPKQRRISFNLAFPWEAGVVEEKIENLAELPFIFDKLSRTIAHGELWFGRGTEFSNFISVNCQHDSVASGIIINGQPFSGMNGSGGGFGHITLDDKSEIQCICGNYGCLQALTSSRGLEYSARKALESGVPSMLYELCRGNVAAVTIQMISQAARDGDPLAQSIYRQAAHYIGLGVAALINIFSPEAIFIGGQAVTGVVDNLFDIIAETASQRAIQHLADHVRIFRTTLGNKATLIGGVSLILEEILNLNIPVTPRRRELAEAL